MAITKPFGQITPENLTPDHVRGLRLGETTRMFGTLGLKLRFKDEIERNGMAGDPSVRWALNMSMLLHANQPRTNGSYKDHILRVALRPMIYYGVIDPKIVAACLLHDSVEDQARLLVYILTGTRETNEHIARERSLELIGMHATHDVARVVEVVSNPLLLPGEDKNLSHLAHTRDVIIVDPDGKVVKVSDFVDNAVGNHHTIGQEKQIRGDIKYVNEYQFHESGLVMPNSRIIGQAREDLILQLDEGHDRALARLSLAGIEVPRSLSSN